MRDDSELIEAIGRARAGSEARIRELLQSSPRRAHALLRASIRRGLLGDTDQVEENALVLSMMMSRNSIRSALAMLGNEGLIRRRQRIGTNIVGSIFELPLLSLLPTQGWQFGAQTLEHPSSIEMDSKCVEQSVVSAHEHVKARLGTEADRVVMREDLVSIEGMPVGVIVGYYPIVEQFENGLFADTADYLDWLRRLPVTQYEATVEAVNCDERTAKLLELKEGAAILTRETLIRDADGTALMLAYGHYRGDRVALWAEDKQVLAMRPAVDDAA
ncbi:GntR family transcriptional regulator [Subtercola boreus]|uniref:HTH gntR-type domain-containing protein n=1 Tax=Subtercola boreus TaxID=120213 RepID=A0A3E0W8L0_9MICO|nr:GntR family transcriptional regulator [Subtercola boreus]RFA19280.1 hypothetical protein B7R24_11510 [Subtercola boreus]RFA19540.1 hypothetical protein B7R23_11490 [Subtercola boreus]RFA25906.1 hypothetical protein B7R25_11610 [Subtercola boreus]